MNFPRCIASALVLPTLALAAYIPIIPTGETTGQSWKYTTTTPAATWNQPSFSDAAWSTGQSGFGTAGTPGITVRTTWSSADIWLRMTVNPGAIDNFISSLALRVIHDEDVEVYINGAAAFSETGYITEYKEVAVSAAGRAAIRSNSANLIAVHCHQTSGGQGVDVGLGYMPSDTLLRSTMLAPYKKRLHQIIFTKHADLGGSHYAYTEALSNAEAEWNFTAGSALCRITIDTADATFAVKVDTLLSTATGIIRDPDISFDGKKILFSWKKSDRNDDFHLYEMTVATKAIRQITSGLGFADFEGCYLPNGNIVFSSTRCVQIVDCWWTEVSNLYICDTLGRYMRRLGFDQVHTNYPTLTPDGTILYTRWEYNDRGQVFPQPLFEMYPDGTRQTAFYGNNSWFPTSILHARSIPGTSGKVVAIFSGHHNKQMGKLGIIDPAKGREENSGATLIAPVRTTNADRIDSYGQEGDVWKYPYPVDTNKFLVAFRPSGAAKFGIYFTNSAGQYCLLAVDANISCNQPVPLAPRTVPQLLSSTVDYRKKTGIYTMENIYYGPGMTGVAAGTIKKLRVIGLLYRASGMGANGNSGPAGGALVSTPVGVDNTSWDPKIILGEADVYSDGSASFEVPARVPLYFQAIDSLGRAIQTMRSWSTLQPGETFSCFGCHESKNDATPVPGISIASRTGPKPLKKFYTIPQDSGLSFAKHVQPILNARCISCHDATHAKLNLLATPVVWDADAQKNWNASYLQLIKKPVIVGQANAGTYCNWLSPQSVPSLLPPKSAGAQKSALFTKIAAHVKPPEITAAELDILKCWIDLLVPHDGSYEESMTAANRATYLTRLQKRKSQETAEAANIQNYIRDFGIGVIDEPGRKNRHESDSRSGSIRNSIIFVEISGIRVSFSVPEERASDLDEIALYGMNGRRIAAAKFDAQNSGTGIEISLPGRLSRGTYLIKAKNARYSLVRKIIVDREK